MPESNEQGLVEQLRKTADTMNGSAPVGCGDGHTYTVGYYTMGNRNLDREAADALEAQYTQIAELQAQVERRDRIMAHMLPVHKDGNWVFIDGPGDVELDHGGKMRQEIADLKRALNTARHDAMEEAASYRITASDIEAACKAYWPSHWPHQFSHRDATGIRWHMRRALRAAILSIQPGCKP